MPQKYKKYWINLSDNTYGICLETCLDVHNVAGLQVEYFCTKNSLKTGFLALLTKFNVIKK